MVFGVDIFQFVCLDDSVSELETFDQYLFLVVFFEGLVEDDLVDLLLVERRMGQLLCDLSVVGEHQDTGSVLVKPSNREYPGSAALQEIHDGLFSMRIAGAGDEALRLVHHDVYLFFTLEPFSVEADIVLQDVYLGSEFSDYHSVDGNHSRLDQGVGFTA